jgi:hypothetical protein
MMMFTARDFAVPHGKRCAASIIYARNPAINIYNNRSGNAACKNFVALLPVDLYEATVCLELKIEMPSWVVVTGPIIELVHTAGGPAYRLRWAYKMHLSCVFLTQDLSQ